MMQVAKKVPFDDPNVLNLCRALYAFSNLVILGVYLYLKTAIDKKKGTCIQLPLSPPSHLLQRVRLHELELGGPLLWRHINVHGTNVLQT